MITIYHNPRCSKSREGLQFLEEHNIPHETIKYLDTPFTKQELKAILKKLNYQPIELVRTKESVWKEQYEGKNLSDQEIIDAMVAHPRLIERPIVVKDDRAVVARPLEKISELLKTT